MKATHLVLSSLVWFTIAASAEVYPDAIKLDAPLSTAETVLTADQIGRHLAQMDHGTSSLPIGDQRIVLETALHSLVMASIPESSFDEVKGGISVGSSGLIYNEKKAEFPDWKESDGPHYWISSLADLTPAERYRLQVLQSTYLKHLDPDHVRDRHDPILSVAAVEGFSLVYAGMKIVALHDRLKLGWRDLNVTWVLPSLMYEGAVRALMEYQKHGYVYPLDNYLRLLEALRGDVNLVAGSEIQGQFRELTENMRANLYGEVDPIGSWRIHPYVDKFTLIITTTWLSALATVTPFGIYHALTYGAPALLIEHPVAYTANFGALIAMHLLANVVSRGRMRDRETRLKSDVDRLVDDCEKALAVEPRGASPAADI